MRCSPRSIPIYLMIFWECELSCLLKCGKYTGTTRSLSTKSRTTFSYWWYLDSYSLLFIHKSLSLCSILVIAITPWFKCNFTIFFLLHNIILLNILGIVQYYLSKKTDNEFPFLTISYPTFPLTAYTFFLIICVYCSIYPSFLTVCTIYTVKYHIPFYKIPQKKSNIKWMFIYPGYNLHYLLLSFPYTIPGKM